MIGSTYGSVKSQVAIPIAPVRVLDVLERLGLMEGIRAWWFPVKGAVTFDLVPGSLLERVLRHWDSRTDEFAIALGELGYSIDTVAPLRLSLNGRGE